MQQQTHLQHGQHELHYTIDRIIEHNSRILSNPHPGAMYNSHNGEIPHQEYIVPDLGNAKPASATAANKPKSKKNAKNAANTGVPAQPTQEEMEKLLLCVCGKCGQGGKNQSELDSHLDLYHPELNTISFLEMSLISTSPSVAECLICGIVVKHSSIRDLQHHYMQHLQYKKYKCVCHGYCFHTLSTATAHLMQNNAKRIGKSPNDQHVRNQWTEMSPSGKNNHNDKPNISVTQLEPFLHYTCPECGEEFETEAIWRIHCNDRHDFKTMEGLSMLRLTDTKSRCTICNREITIKTYDTYKLRRHKLTHLPYKAYSCRLCNYSRKRKDDVVTHIKYEHKDIIGNGDLANHHDGMTSTQPLLLAEVQIKSELSAGM